MLAFTLLTIEASSLTTEACCPQRPPRRAVEKDARDAAAVCRQLGIQLHEADFVSQYWNQVMLFDCVLPSGTLYRGLAWLLTCISLAFHAIHATAGTTRFTAGQI